MKSLQQSIDKLQEGAAQSLRKHLGAVGISEWKDITRSALYDLRDEVQESMAASSAKQTLSNLRAILNRVKDEIELPSDFAKILTVKGDSSRATFLTPSELKAFASVTPRTRQARLVQVEFLIEAYTGARISDVINFDDSNFQDGYLTYTSKKTKITATVPVSERTMGWIRFAQEHREDEPTLVSRNRIIRRIAQQAGINEMVKTRRGGVEKRTHKWEVLTSHCARRSTATNLVMSGASITDAKLILGHSSEATTTRYIVASKPNLSEKAMRYFM